MMTPSFLQHKLMGEHERCKPILFPLHPSSLLSRSLTLASLHSPKPWNRKPPFLHCCCRVSFSGDGHLLFESSIPLGFFLPREAHLVERGNVSKT